MKQLLLVLTFLAGWLTASAQDPTVSAPTPTTNPDQVKSAFSDAYTAFTKWDRSHGATLETIQIAGTTDNVAKLSGDYVAIAVGGRNVSDMEYLHADVYSPAAGGVSQVRFGFSLWSGGEKYADAYNTDTPAGQWTSIDIPLSAFGGYNFSNTQVLRMTMTKTPGNTLYLDNVYFYTTKVPTNTMPTVSAPKPTVAASKVRSMFCDEYEPFYNFDCYNHNGVQIAEKTIEGTTDKVLEVKDFRWAHFALGEVAGTTTVNLSGLQKIHFDVYVPKDNVTTSVQPGMFNVATKKEAYSGKQTLTPGQWTSITLKVADFQAVGLSAVNNLTFKDPAGKTGLIYLDNVYFFNEDGDVPTPGEDPTPSGLPIPLAPTPQTPASDVKAFFTDEYSPLFGKFEPTTYSKATVEVLDHDATHKVCRITNLDWCAINLGQRDVSDKGYVHIDLYTPASDKVETFNMGFQLWGEPITYETADGDANWRELKADQWVSFDIPLANFVGRDFATQMAGFRIRKMGKGTLYVDNIYFWGTPQEPDPEYDPTKYPAIQDNTDGELPPMEEPMLGVNLASASGGAVPGTFGNDYMYPRLQDLYYYKAKGVRLIRFPFRAARVLENLDGDALDYDQANSDIKAMKTIVDEAERLGMWVFLDAHDYAERTINGTQQKLGDEVYTKEKFGRMWRMIAEAFQDNSNIWGYDLQNEPKVGASNLVPIYQAAIDSIRKVDTDAQIIIEGANWASAYEWIYGNRSDRQYPEYPSTVAWSYKASSNWDLANLVDPQNKLVYEAHGYFDQDNSGTYQKGYQEVDFKKRFTPFLEWCKVNKKKGLIGEFGVPYVGAKTASDERWMTVIDQAFDFFRSYQVNATYWCGGAMYEANELTVQPDKNALYGNYNIEKSTMGVMEKYITDWAISDPTGISNAVTDNGETTMDHAPAYNLAGQRVDKNYKGIVIVNGKKFIRK
jgi:Endoglucanase